MGYSGIAISIRKNLLKMHHGVQSSHIGSALSSVDILVALYFKVLRINKNDFCDPDRDRFILSKGHAVSALYATLYEKGMLTRKALAGYYRDGSLLAGHSTKNCAHGIEVSTGSLGHGLSMGVGMALAGQYDRREYRVFVLMSDGECEEGSVWEAAMFASHHGLDNLVAIIDYNKIQANGRTNEIINLEPFREKWQSFGWSALEIDGHSIEEIIATLERAPFKAKKPSVIIAHTVKGKGVSFMENKLEWHYRSPDKAQVEAAIRELGGS